MTADPDQAEPDRGDEVVLEPLSPRESRALDAILELAEKSPTRTVSVRQLAEHLGCQTSTAQWHRARLVSKGYIRLVPRGRREVPEVRPTRQRRPDVAYGACPDCGLERRLDDEGLLPRHDHEQRHGGTRLCAGSGRAPKAAA